MLAIVPARGGSRGIPNKNIRVVNGRPLLLHILGTLRQVPEITEIVVSTEDDTIATIARLHGYRVVQRPSKLADDDTPIGPVIEDAVEQLHYNGPVGVFQPTSPCLTADTIRAGIQLFIGTQCDSLGFVAADGHLLWGAHGPLYAQRLNRQENRMQLRELGAFLTAKVPASDVDAIIGQKHLRFEVPASEAHDIDTPEDLEAARHVLARKSIEFRPLATHAIGSGHIRRCLQLAEELSHHEVTIRRSGEGLPRWALRTIIDRGWLAAPPVGADVIVLDKLDTTVREVCELKSWGTTVVTLEDLGPGSEFADLVVNELYDDPRPHVLSGPEWAVLRPEFCGLPEFVVGEGETVLVTFGGTDPSGLLERVAPIVAREARCRVLLPPRGASGAGPSLPGALSNNGCELVDGSVAAAMRDVDLVVTSAGRTAHEAAACGVPVMTIAANERESRHSHCAGVLRLGLGATVSDDVIQESVGRVLGSQSLRAEMSTTARAAVDGRGSRRIVHRIEGLLEGL